MLFKRQTPSLTRKLSRGSRGYITGGSIKSYTSDTIRINHDNETISAAVANLDTTVGYHNNVQNNINGYLMCGNRGSGSFSKEISRFYSKY